jgi:hypothetical protein
VEFEQVLYDFDAYISVSRRKSILCQRMKSAQETAAFWGQGAGEDVRDGVERETSL